MTRNEGLDHVQRIELSPADFALVASVDYALSSNLNLLVGNLELVAEGVVSLDRTAQIRKTADYLKQHSDSFKRQKEQLLNSENHWIVQLTRQLEKIDNLLTDLLIEVEDVIAGKSSDLNHITQVMDTIRPLAAAIQEQPAYLAYRRNRNEADRPIS